MGGSMGECLGVSMGGCRLGCSGRREWRVTACAWRVLSADAACGVRARV